MSPGEEDNSSSPCSKKPLHRQTRVCAKTDGSMDPVSNSFAGPQQRTISELVFHIMQGKQEKVIHIIG